MLKDVITEFAESAYIRPADWLTLPTLVDGDQKIVGLHAVYDSDSNFCALLCTGAYTVDWGDGSAPQNVATGVKAEHNYNWGDVSASTLCSRGYRQVIVTITPQAGQNLVTINFDQRHSSENQLYSTQWLDVAVAGANITSCLFYYLASTVTYGGMMEKFSFVGTCNITTCANMFRGCYRLFSISLFNTSTVTNFSYMFYNCKNIKSVPLFNMIAASTVTYMFYGCAKLVNIPLFNTINVTDFSVFLYGCSSLTSLSLLNTINGTNFSNMLANCTSLQTLPLFNTINGTNFSSMLFGCRGMKVIPALNTINGTNFSSMLADCTPIDTIPLFNTALGLRFDNMFQYDLILQGIPQLNMSSATRVDNMWLGIASLQIGAFASQSLKVSMSYLNAKMARAELVDVIESLYDFPETLTLDAAPASDWVAGDIITGQTSAKTCVCVAKLTALTYTVSTRSGTFTNGEVIGVTGTAAKLADQGLGYPTFASNEILTLDVAPATDWAAADVITGQTSGSHCHCVLKIHSMAYYVNGRVGNFTLDETIGVTGTPAKLANEGATMPLTAGRGTATLTLTGNWGAASLSAAERLVATNRGWSIII